MHSPATVAGGKPDHAQRALLASSEAAFPVAAMRNNERISKRTPSPAAPCTCGARGGLGKLERSTYSYPAWRDRSLPLTGLFAPLMLEHAVHHRVPPSPFPLDVASDDALLHHAHERHRPR